MTNTNTNTINNVNDAAENALKNPHLCKLAAKVCNCDRLKQSERRELVEAGLAYFADRNDGRSGTDMILNSIGRLAARTIR